MSISCTTAYGPQESADMKKKALFWNYLCEEATRANNEGKGFVLQGDLNCWLGSKIIPGDVREQNRNGKLFETFLKNNNLTGVNSLPLCKGVTTREKIKNGIISRSVPTCSSKCDRNEN